MIRRRLLFVVVAAAAGIASACSSAPPAAVARTSGPSAVSGPSAGPDPSAGPVAPAGSSGTAGATPGAGAATSVPRASVPASPDSRAASAALDAYVAGLARLDEGSVARAAQGGPAALASIFRVTAQINGANGGHTSVTAGGGSFSPTSITATSAVFDGTVTLTTTVTGPKGHAAATDTISGPVRLALASGSWRVVDFTYDGRPLAFFPEQARQVVAGVELDVGSILTYGSATTAIVGLGAQSGHTDLRLANTSLVAGGPDTGGQGSFGPGPVVAGILVFPRATGTPSMLRATFDRPAGPPVSFEVALTGQPG